MKKMDEIKEIIRGGVQGKEIQRLYLVLLGVAFLTGFLMLITFSYTDTCSLTAWSLNFWDVLFQGRLDEFYQYTALNLRESVHENCGGNYLWLLPLCVWNFPLWVVSSVTGVMSVRYFFTLCWSKLFFMVMLYITAYFFARICYMLEKDKNKAVLSFVLILVSPEALMSVGYAGQDEIVYVGIFVMALYCFFKGYRKRCYWLMVCCVTLCPIMLVPVLALLLLQEKNLYKLALKGAIMVVPLMLFEMAYKNDAIYQEVKQTNSFARTLDGMLLTSAVTMSNIVVSIAGIMLCAIFFVCYITKEEEDDNYRRKVIYILSLVFAIICFLMLPAGFYRQFLYAPFLILMIMVSTQDMRMNLLLFTAVTYGRTYTILRAEYPQNMNTSYIIQNSWITRLCDLVGSDIYKESSDRYKECLWTRFNDCSPVYHILVSTCVFAAILLLIVINHPKYEHSHEVVVSEKLIITVCVMCMPIVLAAFYVVLLW